jgi:hypothetical protein
MMNPDHLENLQTAVYRNTAQDPMWLGYWIKHFVEAEEIAWPNLAQDIGVSTENLVLLCLCRTPRPDHFQEDLRVVCDRTGAREESVSRILRQEQAMMQWRENTSPASTGWLAAASDGEDTPDQGTELEDDED